MFRTLQILLLFIFAYSVGSSQYIKFNAFDSIDGFELEIDSIEFKNLNNDFEKTFYSDSIVIPKVSSIASNSYESEVRVYPNPAEDELNIKFSSNSTYQSNVKIFDLNGRELYKDNINIIQGINQFKFNISGLNRGMYLIKVANEVEKFIKSSDGYSTEINSTGKNVGPLIKGNQVQSQFDYKFRVYSKNYRPKYYYLEKLEYDTVVNIKLSPEQTPFKNRFVKVELFLKDAVFYYYSQSSWRGNTVHKRYDTLDHKVNLFDALVIRGNYFHSTYRREIDKGNCWLIGHTENLPCYWRSSMDFNIYADEKYINNFKFSYIKDRYYSGNTNTPLDYEYWGETITETIKLDENISFSEPVNLLVKKDLNEINLEYNRKIKKEYGTYSHTYQTYTFQGALDLENSYIKIEFTDIP